MTTDRWADSPAAGLVQPGAGLSRGATEAPLAPAPSIASLAPTPNPAPAATASATPADWYPDPADRTRLRYWDGVGWTERVLDEGPAPR